MIDVSDGRLGTGAVTVKFTTLLVPPAVVTVTSRTPIAAGAIEKVAEAVVALDTLMLTTVIPLPAFIVSPEVKPVPLSATVTVFPCSADAGLRLDRVGIRTGRIEN